MAVELDIMFFSVTSYLQLVPFQGASLSLYVAAPGLIPDTIQEAEPSPP